MSTNKSKKKNELMPFESAKFVKAVANDGMEFIIDQRCLESSKKLNEIIGNSTTRDENNLVVFEVDCDGEIAEKLFEYYYYKSRWDKNPDERPKFDIDPSIALNLIVCAYKYDA